MFRALAYAALFLVTAYCATCVAEELKLLKSPAFNVSYDEQPGGLARIKIQSSGMESVAPFLIENPYRLVIDIPDQRVQKNIETALNNSRLLKAVRIGAHADKIRVVIDFRDAEPPNFSTKATAKELIVSFGERRPAAPPHTPPAALSTTAVTAAPTTAPTVKAAVAAVAPPKIVELKPLPTTTTPAVLKTAAATPSSTPIPPTATSTPAPTPSFTPTKAATSSPTPAYTAAPQPERGISEAAAGQPKTLLSINFDRILTDQSAVVKFVLTKPSEFRLAKQDERSYLLTIPDCRVNGDFLKLPYFPPHDFLGLVMVQVSADGPDAKVLITVDRGIRIASVSKENELWVRPVTR